MMEKNKINNPNYIMVMGGIQLDLSTLEGKRYFNQICRMTGEDKLAKISIFCLLRMWDYIEEHDQ